MEDSMMIPRLLTPILLSFVLSRAIADSQLQCVTLEHSNITNQQLKYSGSYHFALSNDQSLIALYQNFESDKRVTFKLWDSKTGRLLKTRKAENFQELSGQGYLSFSPDDSLVYYAGMSSIIGGDGVVPFWNLEKNRLILSPCETAMGITDVEFSADMTVASTTTVDSFHSLCRTNSTERLIVIPYAAGYPFFFDKERKHLTGFVNTREAYQQLTAGLTPDDKRYISVYPSPLVEHPDKPDSNNSFASLILGIPPQQRFLVAKSQGAGLTLGLWDYRQQQNLPEKVYQREFQVPELDSKEKPVADAYGRMLTDPDGKQAAFLSNSGVLMVFDIASGELRWKMRLPRQHTKEGWKNYNFVEQKTDEQTTSAFVMISQQEPGALLFFDWQTGHKKTLTLPVFGQFSLMWPKQFDQYLLYGLSPASRWLLVNPETDDPRYIDLPDGFSASPVRIPDTSQLIFAAENSFEKNRPYAIALYDWKTGKQQINEVPFIKEDSPSYQYIRLNNEHSVLFDIRHYDQQSITRTTVSLFNLASREHRTLFDKALILDYRPETEAGKAPSKLAKFVYNEREKQTQFCQVGW